MVYWEQTAAFVSRFLSIIPHYSHLNWGLQQAILTPVSLLAMTKWREAGNISIGSKRPHLLMSLNYRQWIFHLTQLQVLESCQLHIGNSNIQSIFLERFWLIERNIFACATTYHLEPIIMNWMTMSFAYCLPRAWVFSGLLNSNCFSIFCSTAWNWDVVVFPIWQVLIFGYSPICLQNDFWALSFPLIFTKSSQ